MVINHSNKNSESFLEAELFQVEISAQNFSKELTTPNKLHGFGAEIFDRDKGQQHHKLALKPWSVAYVNDKVVFGFIGKDNFERLSKVLERSKELGGEILATSWKKLANLEIEAKDESKFAIKFITPTSVSHLAWMEPSSLFKTLCEHWNQFCPDEYKIELPLNSVRVKVLGIEKVISQKYSKVNINIKDKNNEKITRTEWGFTGEILYRCNDFKIARDFIRLLKYAEFTGLGNRTTYSMGHVKVDYR